MVNFNKHKVGLFATPATFDSIISSYTNPAEQAIATQAAALAWNFAMQYASQLQAEDRKDLEG